MKSFTFSPFPKSGINKFLTCLAFLTVTFFQVNIATAQTVDVHPDDVVICPASNTTFTSTSSSSPTPTIQWQRSVNGNTWVEIDGSIDGAVYSDFTTSTLVITGTANSINNYQYRAEFKNINGTVYSNAALLLVGNIWKGNNANTNPNGNWECGASPTSTDNAIIPAVPSGGNMPILNGNLDVNDLVLLGSATIDLDFHVFTIHGKISGSGKLIGRSTSDLVIAGSGEFGTLNFDQSIDGSTNVLKSFTLNRTTGGTAILGNKLCVLQSYTPTAGVLTTGGNLVFKSTGINATAYIAAGDAAGGYIDGNVSIERFIPAGKRGFRQLASGVNSSSNIYTNWQENGGNTAGLGMHIVGSKTGANGFDQTISGAANMFTYIAGASNFTGIPNTNATNLKALQGYRVFLNGDRNADLTILNNDGPGLPNYTLNSDVTLRATGTIASGTVVYNTTGATANGSTDNSIKLGINANEFAMIANPYWSPVDWDAITTKTDLTESYWIWDPSIGNRGAYISYTSGSGSSGGSITKDMQPGQAIFIRNKPSMTTGSEIIFEEAFKSAVFTNTFRAANQTPSKMRMYLYTNTSLANNGTMQDAATVAFRDDFLAAVGNEDAAKFTNTDENLAIVSGAFVLGLEGRPTVMATDTILLRIWKLYSNNQYTLKFDGMDFDAGITGVLVDKKLNQEHVLNMNGSITLPFTFSNSDSSSYYNRFMLVFRPAATLPVNFVSVKASKKNTGIQVEWNVSAEVDVVKYEVEKSATGTSFDKAGTVQASNSKGYNWYDASPNNSNNYYRIKVINKDNSTSYSNVVQVKMESTSGDVSVYPNPVKGSVINVQFTNKEKGTYNVQLVNNLGQQVYNSKIVHQGGSASETLQLTSKLGKGVYQLVVTNGERKVTQQVVAE